MVKQQQQQQPPAMADEDFDDLSLFVSGSGSSSLRSFNLNTTDSNSTHSGLQGEQETNLTRRNSDFPVFLECSINLLA